jgi:hypothetical protein
MEHLTTFLASQAAHVPLYLAWLVAIVIAIIRWPQHPRVSLIAILAIVTLWVVTAGGMFVAVWLPWSMRRSGATFGEVGRVMMGITILSSLLQAGCWVAIAFAMFGWRRISDTATPR